jgi:hypothetical protein
LGRIEADLEGASVQDSRGSRSAAMRNFRDKVVIVTGAGSGIGSKNGGAPGRGAGIFLVFGKTERCGGRWRSPRGVASLHAFGGYSSNLVRPTKGAEPPAESAEASDLASGRRRGSSFTRSKPRPEKYGDKVLGRRRAHPRTSANGYLSGSEQVRRLPWRRTRRISRGYSSWMSIVFEPDLIK